MLTEPTRIESPVSSSVGDVTRSLPRKVPFLLPQSSSRTPSLRDHQPRVTTRDR